MKILSFPRDLNPYQDLLYGELQKLGFQVTGLGRITPLYTLNILLLPVELLFRRAAGAKIVHLHWVWGFALPGMKRHPVVRKIAYAWFRLFLWTVKLLGMKLAWTAHNVLPHEQVFPDDVAARRLLARNSDIVFVHSEWTIARLAELGAGPSRWVTIRHAPFGSPVPSEWLSHRVRGKMTEFLFFGKISEYKGVEDLLEAFGGVPAAIPAHLTVAGQCTVPELEAGLREAASQLGNRVTLRLGRIPEPELGPLLNMADIVVLPFRRVTTSGSAVLALSYGKPVIIPKLDALADLPDDAVLRYGGSIAELASALENLAGASDETLIRMGKAGLAYSAEATWAQAAEKTAAEFRRILS